MIGLKPEEKPFAQSEITRQAQICIGCDRALPKDNLVDPARRDFDSIGKAVLAELDRFEEFLKQDFAGVGVGKTFQLSHAESNSILSDMLR